MADKKRGNGEGHIRPYRDGWEARINVGFNEKGKQKVKTFYGKTRKEVADKLADFIANQKQLEPEVVINDTVGEWCLKWLDNYVVNNVKLTTRVSYESIINNYYITNTKRLDIVFSV